MDIRKRERKKKKGDVINFYIRIVNPSNLIYSTHNSIRFNSYLGYNEKKEKRRIIKNVINSCICRIYSSDGQFDKI